MLRGSRENGVYCGAAGRATATSVATNRPISIQRGVAITRTPLILLLAARPDLVELTLKRQLIERVEPQAREDLQPGIQFPERPAEGPALLLVGSLDGRGVGQTPVRRHR